MTVERKLIVGLDDLQRVIFECRNPKNTCRSRVSVAPDEEKIPSHCPSCGLEWVRYPLSALEVSGTIFTQFVQQLAKARRMLMEKSAVPEAAPRFCILLEFDEPSHA